MMDFAIIDQPVQTRNRTYTVVGLLLAMFLGALDQTIVSTALPRIVEQLGGLDRYTWVSTVYLLVSTLLVPIYGKLADILSRRALEIWSVTTFVLGSALCGMAGEFGALPLLGEGMTQLIVFRGVQALGGAGLFAMALIIVSDLYAPRDRGKIGGLFGAVWGLASVIGPLTGGFLTDNAGGWIGGIDGWRWVFYVNLPLGVVALWFIATYMPRLRPPDSSHQFDFLSAFLMLATFFPLVFALQLDKTQYPWTSWQVTGQLAASVLFAVLWVWHSLKVSQHPVVDLRLFRNRVFLTSSVAALIFGAGFFAVIVFLPLYMVNVKGVSATAAGASIIPMTLGLMLGAGVGGPIVSKIGRYKAVMVIGSVMLAVAGLLMTRFQLDTPLWQVVGTMFVAGLGFGPGISLYSIAVQNVVQRNELGQATSFSQFIRQIGSTAGVAVVGAIFSAALATAFAAHLPAGATGAARTARSAVQQGPAEIRRTLEAGFDRRIAELATLFDLRGAEAAQAVARVKADPSSPQVIKDMLNDGTPAVAVEAGYQWLEAALEGIVVGGDRDALEVLFASPEAARVPQESREAVVALLGLAPEARLSAIPQMRAQMGRDRDSAIDAATATVFAKVKTSLEDAKRTAADTVTNGIRESFVEAMRPIWWYNVLIFSLLIVANLFIPSIPLKGKQDLAAEEGAATAAAH